MAGDASLSRRDGSPGGPMPLAARRLRAIGRRTRAWLRDLLGLRAIEGRLDRAVAGDLRGWAMDPNRPGRRVHVVARCEGRVVAEALADVLRRDLVQDGRGDGRHGFVLRLPAALLDGSPRSVQVEALSAWGSVRLAGGRVVVGDEAPDAARGATPTPLAAPSFGAARAEAEPHVALVLVGDAGEAAARRTARSWEAQDWPHRLLLAADDPAAAQRLAEAHTVVFARPGDVLVPAAARLLAQVRPLHDVVTWNATGPGGRRPEARALGVLLGESLGDAFAVRGRVLAALKLPMAELTVPTSDRLVLSLAASSALRWAHVPAELVQRPGAVVSWRPVEAPWAERAPGFAWRGGEGRPGRLVPAPAPRRISLAIWPAPDRPWSPSIDAWTASAEGCELEWVLPEGLPADLPPGAQVRRASCPPGAAPGGWWRALTEAAGGEAVALVRSDLRPDVRAGGLAELAAWALHPAVGACTVEVRGTGGRLAGLGVATAPHGWTAVSGFDPGRAGQPRPVLACPAEFLVVSRARLAAAGGLDAQRFPHAGGDLDLGLSFRRTGLTSLLLDSLSASAEGGWLAPGPAELAAFDAAELAAAADAFPDAGGESA